MLKELVLVRCKRKIDQGALAQLLSTAQSRARAELSVAASSVRRHVMNRAILSSNRQAVGAAAPYDFVAETWLAEKIHPEERTWFEAIYQNAMPMIDRPESISFLAEEVVVHPGRSGNVNIISLLRRNSAMSAAEFSVYWKERHAALIQTVPEFWEWIRGYVQNHVVPNTSRTLAGAAAVGFDGITQLWFDSDQDAVRAFSAPRYLAIIRPDEKILRSGDPFRLLANEVVVVSSA